MSELSVSKDYIELVTKAVEEVAKEISGGFNLEVDILKENDLRIFRKSDKIFVNVSDLEFEISPSLRTFILPCRECQFALFLNYDDIKSESKIRVALFHEFIEGYLYRHYKEVPKDERHLKSVELENLYREKYVC